jgi:DNA mismatch endonuclease (patch repair protein)
VIFVNGCFWHGHKQCKKGDLPDSNKDFWKEKIMKNIKRDENNILQLTGAGWKVLTVWECESKDFEKLSDMIDRFLEN